jgi:hypothetical protein
MIEKKVSEIKEVNQFIIPESIRYRYNHIYSFNVFLIMKEYKTNRLLNIQKLVDVTNEINKKKSDKEVSSFRLNETNQESSSFHFIFRKKEITDFDEKYRKMNIYDPGISLSELYKIREVYTNDIIKYRNLSNELNNVFNGTLSQRKSWKNYIFNPEWLKT